MSDSAVKRDSAVLAKARHRRPDKAATGDRTETEKKLARAARSTQRLAQLSEAQRIGETLDLFAEDAERAQQQAMNTDIRQRSLEGFELPDVFLQAVQGSNGGAPASAPGTPKRTAQAAAMEPVQASFPDLPTQADAAPAAHDAATPSALAASLIAHDHGIENVSPRPRADTVPELDRARVRAFSDTIDALHAVIVEQRASTAVHARRMKTMLTIIVCAMLVTVVTGIAQTALLMRIRHDVQPPTLTSTLAPVALAQTSADTRR
jgi:hypothetical protein